MRVVREFYSALGAGDGQRAAEQVVPEKRAEGALSARRMSRFYSSLRRPLRIITAYPLDERTVFVRYEFVAPGGGVCVGAANVVTAQRDGQTLVRGIRALNGC